MDSCSHPVSSLAFREPVSSTVIRVLTPPLQNDSFSGTTSHGTYKDQEGESVTEILGKGRRGVRAQDESGINVLPDNVLLEIFDLCRKDLDLILDIDWFFVWGPNGLVHVCRRWRQLVFGSPRRLDLQIHCTRGTPVRKNLGCWPPIPISILYSNDDDDGLTPHDTKSLFFVLTQHPDRIREVFLELPGEQLAMVTAMMQQPFPVLTRLSLCWEEERPPALPRGFLGGSAPCLQHLHLEGIPFPTLPMLLSSTSDLVYLHLNYIPKEGFISPGAMAKCLAGLPRLQSLLIGFQMVSYLPKQIILPPVTRALLPGLTRFEYRGASKYLEEFCSRIDGPRVNQIHLEYTHQLTDFPLAQLFQFLDRSEDSEFTLIGHAEVNFLRPRVTLDMYPHSNSSPACVGALINCQGIKQQISHIARVFSQPSAIVSGVVHLKLCLHCATDDRHDNEWLHLFRQFSAIRTLHVTGKFAGHVALALNDVTAEMVAEVLPALDLIFIHGQPVSCVEKFLAARQLSVHPVAVVEKEAEFYARAKLSPRSSGRFIPPPRPPRSRPS